MMISSKYTRHVLQCSPTNINSIKCWKVTEALHEPNDITRNWCKPNGVTKAVCSSRAADSREMLYNYPIKPYSALSVTSHCALCRKDSLCARVLHQQKGWDRWCHPQGDMVAARPGFEKAMVGTRVLPPLAETEWTDWTINTPRCSINLYSGSNIPWKSPVGTAVQEAPSGDIRVLW